MSQNDLVGKITGAVMNKLRKSAAGHSGAGRTGSGGSEGSRPAASGSRPASSSGSRDIPSAETLIAPGEIAGYIDHTILKPDATAEEIAKVCDEAIEHTFYSVCVNSSWVEFCARRLRGTGVKVTAVAGFPLGAMDRRTKAFEARRAVKLGADEIDMVMNIGALKSGERDWLAEDIRAVRRSIRRRTVLKVILETGFLTDEEKILACQTAKNAKADFVKTSTGFGKGGATTKDIALMRRTVGAKMGVKASGGVRTYEDAVAMIHAGATRIGASSSVALISGGQGTGGY